MDPNNLISMVNPRGRVSWVHNWEVANLKEQGYRVIINPKESYYPNLDLSLNPSTNDEIIPENIDPTAVLEVEEV